MLRIYVMLCKRHFIGSWSFPSAAASPPCSNELPMNSAGSASTSSSGIRCGQGCWDFQDGEYWLDQSLSSRTKELVGRGSACSSISNSRAASPLIGLIVWASTVSQNQCQAHWERSVGVKSLRHLNLTSATPTAASIKNRTDTTAFLLLRPQIVFLLTMLSRLA